MFTRVTRHAHTCTRAAAHPPQIATLIAEAKFLRTLDCPYILKVRPRNHACVIDGRDSCGCGGAIGKLGGWRSKGCVLSSISAYGTHTATRLSSDGQAQRALVSQPTNQSATEPTSQSASQPVSQSAAVTCMLHMHGGA